MNLNARLALCYQPVAEPLEEARNIVAGFWRDALALVPAPGGSVSAAPPSGKGLRPALCLMATGACGLPNLQDYAPMAAAFEALHLASLAHDDVIDRALTRRGAKSLNALWDNHAAVLGGDYLVARAIETLAEYGDCGIVSRAVATVRRMAEAELAFFGLPLEAATPDKPLNLARGKTASLFSAACSAPARSANEPMYQEALETYGMALGMAFQLTDDLLDLCGDPDHMGKPICHDVEEGKPTYPIVLLHQRLNETERAIFRNLFGRPIDAGERQWILDRAWDLGVTDQARETAEKYIQEALAALEVFRESPWLRSLRIVCEIVMERDR